VPQAEAWLTPPQQRGLVAACQPQRQQQALQLLIAGQPLQHPQGLLQQSPAAQPPQHRSLARHLPVLTQPLRHPLWTSRLPSAKSPQHPQRALQLPAVARATGHHVFQQPRAVTA
jgi:hypothetical protein